MTDLEIMGKCGGCKYCYYYKPGECYLCSNAKGLRYKLSTKKDYCSKFTPKSTEKGASE